MSSVSYPFLKPERLVHQIVANAVAGRAVFIHGNAGIGKSQQIYRICSDSLLKAVAWGKWLEAQGLDRKDTRAAWVAWAAFNRIGNGKDDETPKLQVDAGAGPVESEDPAETEKKRLAALAAEAAWIDEVAALHGKGILEFPDLAMVHLTIPQHEPEDFLGVPRHKRVAGSGTDDDMVTAWAPVEAFRSPLPFVLFLDEVSAAETRTQKVLLQLVQERKIANVKLAEGTIVLLAGNLAEDRAALKSVPFPLGNRCAHYQMRVSSKSWIKWAEPEGISAIFRAYVEERKESALHGYKAEDPSLAQLTPRSLAGAAQAWQAGVELGFEAEELEDLVCANIGNGSGRDLLSYLRLSEKLPKWNELSTSPDAAGLPQKGDLSMTYYAMGMILDNVRDLSLDKKAGENAFKWVQRVVIANPFTVDAVAWMLSEIVKGRQKGMPEPIRKHAVRLIEMIALNEDLSDRVTALMAAVR